MKKLCLLFTMLTTVILLSACGVSSNDYMEVSNELDSVKAENETLKTNLENSKSETEELKTKVAELEKIIEPYKDLSAAEIEAQTNEANLKAEKDKKALEAIEKKEAEEKAAKEKEEAAAKEKEEKAGYDTGITYSQLARTPDKYTNKKVKFSGEVLQVMEGDGYNQMRLAVNSEYDDVLYVEYDPSIVSIRILEDDYITIYGVSYGLFSYQSTMGGTITIPSVVVDKIEQ
ncbi:toxin regulator [Anaerocolumna sp. AGMB13020]|uniref:toxin regulator n=1 Tax=Anaerocolumna sp. AGMB13020 TaxID=3081750 RepID=UPI0029534618|nr:toxin regulator [Anaerocolumna sp. AGMB13020]WOO34905.1 toxin regulator [Anaerocolumna sp. AGMB13020]